MGRMSRLVWALVAVLIVTGCAAQDWRHTMKGTAWTNVSSRRALLISHGGDPDYITRPYDSMSAFVKAFHDGTDAVKGDLRFLSDGVTGIVMHSSPIEIYESLNCAGKRVEDLTLNEATACKMFPTSEHFISANSLLSWSDGKVITMLCVKRPEDIPAAINAVYVANATERAFLEIRVNDLLTHVVQAKPEHWDKIFYLAELGSEADLNVLLSPAMKMGLPAIFAAEFDTDYATSMGNATELVAQLHSHGLKAVAETPKFGASGASQESLFRNGFDIVYALSGQVSGIKARDAINRQRGITPAGTYLETFTI